MIGTAACYAGLGPDRRPHRPLAAAAPGVDRAARRRRAHHRAVRPRAAAVRAAVGGAIAAVVALGALGSGVAYLLYFALIASAGASRAILVTYLVPAFALVYGAVLLDEDVTTSSLVGLALILGGTALATGVGRARR